MYILKERLPSVIAALGEHIPLHDIGRRFRLENGITAICDMNQREPTNRRNTLNKTTMATFTRLVTRNHKMGVPVEKYVRDLQDFSIDLMGIDENGDYEPKILMDDPRGDVEAELLSMVADSFAEGYEP